LILKNQTFLKFLTPRRNQKFLTIPMYQLIRRFLMILMIRFDH
jgi:hypothetical protein